MAYFDFTRLITKYSSEFTAITLKKDYIDDMGYVVDSEKEEITLTGAIISHSENKIFRSEGALTEKDKRLFMLTPIDEKLHGAKIVYEGEIYDLMSCTNNSKFTGVYMYNLKFVSTFKDIQYHELISLKKEDGENGD